jgi:hypothetical protein
MTGQYSKASVRPLAEAWAAPWTQDDGLSAPESVAKSRLPPPGCTHSPEEALI